MTVLLLKSRDNLVEVRDEKNKINVFLTKDNWEKS